MEDLSKESFNTPFMMFPVTPLQSMTNDYFKWTDHYYDHLIALYDIFMTHTRISVPFNDFCSFVYSNTLPQRTHPGSLKYQRYLNKWTQ